MLAAVCKGNQPFCCFLLLFLITIKVKIAATAGPSVHNMSIGVLFSVYGSFQVTNIIIESARKYEDPTKSLSISGDFKEVIQIKKTKINTS
jgi:hypothetical protein